MELLTVDKEMCRRDGICMAACPIGCITADAEGYPVPVNEATCIGCGHCVAICPHGALENSRVPMADFLPAPRERADFPAVAGLMKFRRSVRTYKDQAVPRETLAELLDVARFAPTAVNTQQISYIVTQAPGKTRGLVGGVAEWMRANIQVRPYFARFVTEWDSGRDRILRGAPHVVVALGDANNDWGDTDSAIALTYLELAAAAHGLGVCWAGLLHRALTNSPELAASIGVPANKKVCGALMLGVPKFKYSLVPPRNPAPVSWL
ncbi:MAG: nitroreductase family protein [Proteobacteria bacterium]|nr:nitroreductase family protein [Pseudomonadota bacterium]